MALHKWKKFIDGNYEPIEYGTSTIEIYELNFQSLPEELKKIINSFCVTFSAMEVPLQNKKILKELIDMNSLDFSLEEFLTIGCALQYLYHMNIEMDSEDRLVLDFDTEKKDYGLLLDILEQFLFAEDYKNLHSISFKFNQVKTTSVKNFFIVRDVYEAICLGYGLTKENFYERKIEILSQTNQFLISKFGEKIKLEFVQTLYNLLESNFSKKADVLRFIGVLFHIFQVPTNNNQPIELYENLSTTLSEIDLKNLRHYLNGRLKLFHD